VYICIVVIIGEHFIVSVFDVICWCQSADFRECIVCCLFVCVYVYIVGVSGMMIIISIINNKSITKTVILDTERVN